VWSERREHVAQVHRVLGVRFRAAAKRLVISERQRIEKIARALLRVGTLTGEEIFEVCG
jgi:hypothetical protein